jgi:hypothetical protein
VNIHWRGSGAENLKIVKKGEPAQLACALHVAQSLPPEEKLERLCDS